MENASKALIMAGVILISVMLISLFIYVFTAIGEYKSQTQAQQQSNQIVAANRFFVESAYDINSLRPGVQIKGYDVYNLIGKANDINENPDSPNYIENYSGLSVATVDLNKEYTYTYGLDSEGYVNSINFSE